MTYNVDALLEFIAWPESRGDIDIVYDNEVLCTSLTGKTIVVLYIRQKPN